MEWAKSGTNRIRATPGRQGCCPSCGAQLQAKCGEIKIWHWAHHGGDCDPWHENETLWHLNWKGLFPEDWQEVVLGPHRADIRTPRMVIELQHSSISVAELREREAFYGDMIWIFDFRKIAKHFFFPRHGGALWFEENVVWQRARRSVFACTKPVLITLGRGLLYNIYGFGYHPDPGYQGGFSYAYSKDEFLSAVGFGTAVADPRPFVPFPSILEPKLAARRLPFFPEERSAMFRTPVFTVTPASERNSPPTPPIPLHRFSRDAVRAKLDGAEQAGPTASF